MRKSKLILLLLFFTSSVFAFSDKHKDRQFPPERHEVIVRLILMDAIVTDKEGNYIKDLTKEDFEVYEDGIQRPIHSIELISPNTKEWLPKEILSERKDKETKSRRRIYIVFDCINTDTIALRRSKEKVINTLNNLLKVGFEVMIIEINFRDGIRILNDFSSNPNDVKDVVAKVGGSSWIGDREVLERSKEEISANLDILLEKDKSARTQRMIDADNEQILFEGRNILQKSISYLLYLIGLVKIDPGRKSILLISNGFPKVTWKTLVRIFDPFEIIQKKEIKNYIEIMNEIIRYANTYNISFYCLNPSNIMSDMMIDYDAFIHLAEDTGGEYFQGQNKYLMSEDKIKRDLSYYYEIAFPPLRKIEDGKFHRIEVRVRNKALRVKFKEGYTDYKEEDIKKRNIAAAFFAPSFYKDIKFTCNAVALPQNSELFSFWLWLNLPLDQFREESFMPLEKMDFLFGIKEKNEEKVHLGVSEIDIKKAMETGLPNYYIYFGTSGLKFKPGVYEVSVILTYKKEKIGAWSGWIQIPNLEEQRSLRILNFITGDLVINHEGGLPFSISSKDGSLRLRKYKFIPSWKDEIEKERNLPVFIQIIGPKEKSIQDIEFYLEQESEQIRIPSLLIEKEYGSHNHTNSFVYLLLTEKFPFGDYFLKIRVMDSLKREKIEIGKKIIIKK